MSKLEEDEQPPTGQLLLFDARDLYKNDWVLDLAFGLGEGELESIVTQFYDMVIQDTPIMKEWLIVSLSANIISEVQKKCRCHRRACLLMSIFTLMHCSASAARHVRVHYVKQEQWKLDCFMACIAHVLKKNLAPTDPIDPIVTVVTLLKMYMLHWDPRGGGMIPMPSAPRYEIPYKRDHVKKEEQEDVPMIIGRIEEEEEEEEFSNNKRKRDLP